jgi:type III pantothenate kinase
MQLVIDIGNTRIKAASFQNEQLLEFKVFKDYQELLESDFFKDNKFDNCIVASVVNDIEQFVEQLAQKVNVLVFSADTPLPIKNLYKSITTLGSDRLAAAVGGELLFPNQNVLVIDAGTCIKYNFLSNEKEYLGGAISPGLQMRFRALHTFTAKLPLLPVDQSFDSLIGVDTNGSIYSGVETGATLEIDGFIEQYRHRFADLNVILTGGDVNFFEKRLKNSIFADSYLILKGLNRILNYNIKEHNR